MITHAGQLPQNLRETVERVYGEPGSRWLETLPSLLSTCCARWSLKLDQPFQNLSYNLVLPGKRSDGTDIVLKLGVPNQGLTTEAAALSLFNGMGAVPLLDQDGARGILLMERITPGTPLFELHGQLPGEIEATRTAARVMRRLWHTPPQKHSFPSLTIWFQAFKRLRKRFAGGAGPFPSEVINRAESMFVELNDTTDRKVILHGDLHHANILLSSDKGWMAIDPKGVYGDPGYEIGPFMINRLPAHSSESATIDILKLRLSIFSEELQISRERLGWWAFCHAVLSAVWNFEDGEERDNTIHLAQVLEKLV